MSNSKHRSNAVQALTSPRVKSGGTTRGLLVFNMIASIVFSVVKLKNYFG